MTKPVDLIVANVMHESVGKLAGVERLYHSLTGNKMSRSESDDAADVVTSLIARDLLKRLADEAPLIDVFAALAAVKAPSSKSDIKEGMQAVRDRQEAK